MKRISIIIFFLWVSIACNKQNDWLDVPRKKTEVTLRALNDFQEVLNNTSIFNKDLPLLGQLGADNYFVLQSSIDRLPRVEHNSYLWNKVIFESNSVLEYTFAYSVINSANSVLDYIERIEVRSSEESIKENIIGQALFFRAFTYLEIASVFCKAYNVTTANSDKGVCLRSSSDINLKVGRSTIQETYEFILRDAVLAASLLNDTERYTTRPSKPAAQALLARIYLNMGNYEKAGTYADSVLKNPYSLIDFNVVPSLSLPYRFPDFRSGNPEIIFYAQGYMYSTLYPNENPLLSYVDSSLIESYELEDLRRRYFFSGSETNRMKFMGSYTGIGSNFAGLAVNEMYLIKAECLARIGSVSEGVEVLNQLLFKRMKSGSYRPYVTNDADTLLARVILERRKELPFTGQIRWQDLRRLNLDPRLATQLKRIYNGNTVSISPNDPKYVYPFPIDEIVQTGIEQNER